MRSCLYLIYKGDFALHVQKAQCFVLYRTHIPEL